MSEMAAPPSKKDHASVFAQLITDYLGPNVPSTATNSIQPGESLNGKVVATLPAMRDRLIADSATFNTRREVLAWQVREAIRTEFFKIQYPATPTPKLLKLVTATEALLTDFGAAQRPLYFPGARVAVPTEVGTHRAATTLQIRFKPVNGVTVTEVLLHLDGPRGGGFQFVSSTILMPLSACVPIRNPVLTSDARATQQARPAPTQARTSTPRGRRGSGNASTTSGGSRSGRSSRPRSKETRPSAVKLPTTNLPLSFLPHALRSSSPPPKKRLRHNVSTPISLTTGSVRRTLDVWNESSDALEAKVPLEVQNKVLENTLAVERLIGRRRNMNLGGVVEYCVKWSGAPLNAASWESRDSLMKDIPGLVLAFDMAHPNEPVKCLTEVAEDTAKESEPVFIEIDCAIPKPASKQILDDATGIPIPNYLDTPIIELNFTGLQLHVRRDYKCSLFSSDEEAAIDRKKRILQFRKENPEAFVKIFANNSSEYHKEPEMVVEPKLFVNAMVPTSGGLLPILQHSLESHKYGNRRPILFPRGLGQVLPRDVAMPVPDKDIINAPASWESYLMSLGMRCKNWERELLPDMPTASSQVKIFMEVAANVITDTCKNVRHERDRDTWIESTLYTGTRRSARSNGNPVAASGEAGESSDGIDDGTKTPNSDAAGSSKDDAVKAGKPSLQDSSSIFRAALEFARDESEKNIENGDNSSCSRKKEREYDAVWGCWKDSIVE